MLSGSKCPRARSACLCACLLLIATSRVQAQFVAGQQFYNQQALSTINALGAYTQGYSGNGVTIGVVDSGVDPNHIAVSSALVAAMGWSRTDSENVMVNNWVSQTGTSNFSSFINDLAAGGNSVAGHGTFVTSIAAGRLNGVSSADNIMGVAYNANVVLGQYVFSQLNDARTEVIAVGLNPDQVAQTINFVSSRGVKVINNSWGEDYAPANLPKSMTISMREYVDENGGIVDALKRAQDRGAVIVFAAGNDGLPFPTAPATLPSVDPAVEQKGGWIVVAATTNRGINPATGQIEMARGGIKESTGLPYYTNYCGEAMMYCISAPGGLLVPSVAQGDVGMGGALADTTAGYGRNEGTSFAAPVVTGAVALVAGKFPWMTAQNLGVTILTTGTTAANPSPTWGRGLLDVGRAMNGPGIFEQDFNANVTAGYRSTFGNDISGTAGLIKDGVGTLIMAGANTYSGTTHILNGTLGLSGRGAISQSSSVLNSGVLDLTNASPVVTLANTYTQTASGVLGLGVRPGQGQQLLIGGTASLAGVLAVQGAAGVYTPGRFTLLSAGTIAGQFDAFSTNIGDYTSFKTYQSYGGNNIFLNIVRPYADTVVENSNAVSRGAAQALYDMAGTPTSINGAMAPALNALNAMGGAAQSNAIRQTLPVFLGGASLATYNTQRAFQQTIMARIDNIRGVESGDYFASDRSIWMKPFGNITSQSGLNDIPGYRATGGGLAVGVDHKISDDASLGGVFAYSYNAISGSGDTASNNLGINAYQLGVYGAYAIAADTDLSYQADLGVNQNRETRSISFMSTSAQANYSSYTTHLGAGIRKVIPVTPAFNAVPLLRVDYAAINANAYTESGAGALNLNVQSQTYQELMFTAGLKGDYQATDRVKLTASAGIGYNALNSQAQIAASYAGGGNSFMTQGFNGSPWLYSAGVGIVGNEKHGVELSARYDVQASPTGFLNQMASVRVSMRY